MDIYRHFFYNSSWQIVETRKATSEQGENTQPETLQPEYQYVWSLRYIDAPILRDKNTDADDLCDDERLYYLNDANMNVTALLDTNGDAVERYIYDPYGKVTILNGKSGVDKDGQVTEWTADADQKSDVDNRILFCGYYRDAETGLMQVRHRPYHIYLGWITREPKDADKVSGGYHDGMNVYEYVGSKPVNALDPNGLKTWTRDSARAEVKKQITTWRGKGYNFAADLMQYFLDKKGPADYVPTQANIDELKNHGTIKILDLILYHIAPSCTLPDTGTYNVNIAHPGKGSNVESNIRWPYYQGTKKNMLYAYGGADLNVTGKVFVIQEYKSFLMVLVVKGEWYWSGRVKVSLGDLYTFDSSYLKKTASAWRSDPYDAALWLETKCGYKPFYHKMEFDLSWQRRKSPYSYRNQYTMLAM